MKKKVLILAAVVALGVGALLYSKNKAAPAKPTTKPAAKPVAK